MPATITLYGVIGDPWDKCDARTVAEWLDVAGDQDITVRLNSPGGYCSDGLAIYNRLREAPGRKTIVIDGMALSMATIVALAGDDIEIVNDGLVMVHEPWNVAIGNAERMRKEAAALEANRDLMARIYAERTGLAVEAVLAIMAEETWMTPAEALLKGFVTKVRDQEAADDDTMAYAGARMGFLQLKHDVPARLRQARERSAAVAAVLPGKPADPKGNSMTTGTGGQTAEQLAAAQAEAVQIAAAAAATAAVAAERDRAQQIRLAVASVRGLDVKLADELIDAGTPLDQARARVLTEAAKLDGADTPNHVRVYGGADGRAKMRDGMQVAIMARAGYAKREVGNEFSGLTLREMARECLAAAGVPHRGLDPLELIKMAITHHSSDFPTLLANTAHKSMLRGYEEAEETFPDWTVPGTLTDFKATSRVDLNVFPSLRNVPEGAEYKYATMGDRGETIILATYGELFSITRQAIINDDLGAFTRVPQKMGRAAKRTVGNLVYAILTGNPAMADTVALFHASHGNLKTGGGSALAVAGLEDARSAMALQKDRSSSAVALNIRPRFLIVPVALQATANMLMASEFNPAQTQRVPNTARGMATVISDARLDAASTTAWYLVADPRVTDTIEVAYLDGQAQPFLDEQEGWRVDGVEYKVRIDAGVKALAWEGMLKSAGA